MFTTYIIINPTETIHILPYISVFFCSPDNVIEGLPLTMCSMPLWLLSLLLHNLRDLPAILSIQKFMKHFNIVSKFFTETKKPIYF